VTFSLAQSVVHGTFGGGGNPHASLASTTAGNLLVAIIGGSSSGGISTSFTMPAGWTLVNSGTLTVQVNSGSHAIIGFAFYWNNPGGITSVTATFNDGGGNTSGWIELQEWSGALSSSNPFDSTAGLVTNGVNGAGGALSATLTPTLTDSLVIAAFTGVQSGTNDWGTDAGWTQDDVFHYTGYNTGVAVQHVIDAALSAETANITVPGSFVASVLGMIAFQATDSNAGSTYPVGYERYDSPRTNYLNRM